MKIKIITKNQNFIGRTYEKNFLSELIKTQDEARIIIIYGRRRVGKTELIEQVFKDRNILKFEGIEGGSVQRQQEAVLSDLAKYAEEPFLAKITPSHWLDIFELINKYISQGTWTLYFEELQWLANYQTDFIAELKTAWDNFFKNNPKLIIILCGSSPSFMIEDVLKSKSLYNRSQYELPIRAFSLSETQEFLKNKSLSEIMDAYLLLGGMPEYLKRAKQDSSVLLSIAKQSFVPGGFFTHEYERIFISSLASNINYQKIVEFLGTHHFASRIEIQKYLKIDSGGTLSTLLFDLEECGLIQSYTPFDTPENSKLIRYAISDAYLQFFYKFIKPKLKAIEAGDFIHNPLSALDFSSLEKWKGFAFERFCRAQHRLIAKILGFEAVKYQHGAYFNRALNSEHPGFQIDLIFARDDKVFTICEIKYLSSPVSKKVIAEFDKKIELFNPKKSHSIQKVLITANGAEEGLINAHYFDRILVLEDFFK